MKKVLGPLLAIVILFTGTFLAETTVMAHDIIPPPVNHIFKVGKEICCPSPLAQSIYRDHHHQKRKPGHDAPQNLEVTVLSYSSIELTWDKGDFPAVGYRIERRSSSGSWVTIANLDHRTRSYTDTGLDRYTHYYYRVRAYNLLEDSDYSEEIDVCTGDYYDESKEYRRLSNKYNDQPLVIILQVGRPFCYIDHKPVSMDAAPVIREGRTLIPLRFLAESVGAEVDWNDYQKKVTIFHKGEVIELWVGRNTARINGERFSIDPSNAQLTPIVENGRIMLPLRFITENLGFEVEWLEATQEIILTYLH